MTDMARKKTDKKLKEMEKKLKQTYQQTKDELEEKWFQFMRIQGEKVKAMQDEYYAIKKTGDKKAIEEYGKKLGIEKRNLTLKNAYYKEMVDETTTKIAQTNQIAVAYINNQMPDIYAINFNDAYKNAVKGFQGISYTLVDEHTVRDLVKDNRLRLPKKKVNIPKDKRWNAKQLNSSMLQGILQGESIDDMATRILPVVDNNMTASYRTARTMTTNCENKGRQDRLDDLSDQGLDIEKTWLATDDERTRESHMLMDGETVPYDEEFSNGLMYPADENGDPSEVYNCRCTMTTNILGWKKR
jgi:SPP1 gp7 family putative phage head morphogenesis protein